MARWNRALTLNGIAKVTLSGTRVRLEPLEQRHVPSLATAITDGALWELPVTLVPQPPDLPKFVEAADVAFHAQRELAFATIDAASGTVVGSTRFRNIELAHKRVEIGFTFIAKSWQRTYINTEAKLLMLGHAFEQWDCNRVELLTDSLNTTSRAAIARLGAREEGILRSHMIMRGGRIRDSVVFSLIKAEWPAAKSRLEAILLQAKI